jgi:hypothetical protein
VGHEAAAVDSSPAAGRPSNSCVRKGLQIGRGC